MPPTPATEPGTTTITTNAGTTRKLAAAHVDPERQRELRFPIDESTLRRTPVDETA